MDHSYAAKFSRVAQVFIVFSFPFPFPGVSTAVQSSIVSVTGALTQNVGASFFRLVRVDFVYSAKDGATSPTVHHVRRMKQVSDSSHSPSGFLDRLLASGLTSGTDGLELPSALEYHAHDKPLSRLDAAFPWK